MNSLQITKILIKNKITRSYFIGCFASDQIPEPKSLLKFPSCMIVNTDPATGTGEHWIALYVPSPHCVEYFDSLGDWPPPYANIKKYLAHFTQVVFSKKQLQSSRSSSCGYHVIYFLCMRCKGIPFRKIINRIWLSKTGPDALVSGFVRSALIKNYI